METPTETQRSFNNHLESLGYTPSKEIDLHMRNLNQETIATMQNPSSIPRIYQTLFHRTRTFAATVRDLVRSAPQHWAMAASLLVDWSVKILRHPDVGMERFLHSQRQSLSWILDDTLLRICVDQWDPPQSRSSARPDSRTPCVPWDRASAPLRRALSDAERLLPEWRKTDREEGQRQRGYHEDAESLLPERREIERERQRGYHKDAWKLSRLMGDWFSQSRRFLDESTRVYEIWRTVRLCGGGLLPAELANEIVKDVARAEGLPMGNLRWRYLPNIDKKGWLVNVTVASRT